MLNINGSNSDEGGEIMINPYSTQNLYSAYKAFNYYSGLTDAQMKDPETFEGFDFGAEWYMPTEGSYLYPKLSNKSLTF